MAGGAIGVILSNPNMDGMRKPLPIKLCETLLRCVATINMVRKSIMCMANILVGLVK